MPPGLTEVYIQFVGHLLLLLLSGVGCLYHTLGAALPPRGNEMHKLLRAKTATKKVET